MPVRKVLPAQPADQTFLLEMRWLALRSVKDLEKRNEAELRALALLELSLDSGRGAEINLVAWQDSERAGAVWLRSEGEPNALHYTLLGLVVLPAFRRQGIGTLLLQEVINYCQQRNGCLISLKVNPSNEAALHLYSKFGFENITLEMRRKLS